MTQPTSSKKRIFRKGKPITTLENLITELEVGNWVYLLNRPKHPEIFLHMQLGTVLGFLNRKLLFYALRNR